MAVCQSGARRGADRRLAASAAERARHFGLVHRAVGHQGQPAAGHRQHRRSTAGYIKLLLFYRRFKLEPRLQSRVSPLLQMLRVH